MSGLRCEGRSRMRIVALLAFGDDAQASDER